MPLSTDELMYCIQEANRAGSAHETLNIMRTVVQKGGIDDVSTFLEGTKSNTPTPADVNTTRTQTEGRGPAHTKAADMNPVRPKTAKFHVITGGERAGVNTVASQTGATGSNRVDFMLLVAIQENKLNIVKFLVETRGADVNCELGDNFHSWGVFPIEAAACKGSVECLQFLIEKGADVNPAEAGNGPKPLWWAVCFQNLECVRLLVNSGADLHCTHCISELDPFSKLSSFFQCLAQPFGLYSL